MSPWVDGLVGVWAGEWVSGSRGRTDYLHVESGGVFLVGKRLKSILLCIPVLFAGEGASKNMMSKTGEQAIRRRLYNTLQEDGRPRVPVGSIHGGFSRRILGWSEQR